MKTHRFKPHGINGPAFNIALESIVNFYEIDFNRNAGTEIITDDGLKYIVGDSETEVRRIVNESVTHVDFNTSFKVLEDVEKDILEVAAKYDGKISLAAFIGVLEIVKKGFLEK